MKTTLIWVGRTAKSYWAEAIEEYRTRLTNYSPFEIVEIRDIRNAKNLSSEQLKKMEGEAILETIKEDDFVALLDDKGQELTSLKFADWYGKRTLAGTKRLIFIIGGAYGFSDAIYRRANDKLSLSRLTFSHQIVRPLFLEQLYRANTILRHEPYHHE